jgi:hypothetical protein
MKTPYETLNPYCKYQGEYTSGCHGAQPKGSPSSVVIRRTTILEHLDGQALIRYGAGGKFLSREELERETGIEPATNSLEGCDSTTELLPRSFTLLF